MSLPRPSTAPADVPVPRSGNVNGVRKLSVVTTVFCSEDSIEAFVRRALVAARSISPDVELIIVDDGSPDRSLEIARDLADNDAQIVLVQLSRNFGHHKALLTGLELARGDLILMIDSDLEEAPENLIPMRQVMTETNSDVVYGVQRSRRGGWLERASGWAFYTLFDLLSDVSLPRNVSTMRLMSRRYANSFLRFRDQNPVLIPLGVITGYRQVAFPFDKGDHSRTSYSLHRRFQMLLLAVTSFTGRPLVLIFWTSLVFSFASFIYGIVVVVRALTGTALDGWSSLMAATVFFFSLNAFFTGLIGLYIKLILDEVKDRPRTVIQEIYSLGAKSGTLQNDHAR